MSSEDEDIQDVVKEERNRGRKPLDIEAARQKREREAAILKILQRRDRASLEKILKLYYSPEEVKKIFGRG